MKTLIQRVRAYQKRHRGLGLCLYCNNKRDPRSMARCTEHLVADKTAKREKRKLDHYNAVQKLAGGK